MAFCTECGAAIPDGMNFCTSCGAPAAAVPVTAGAAAGEASAPPPEPAREPAPEARQVNAPPVYAPRAAAPSPPTATPLYETDQRPPRGGRYSVMGTGAYIGTMILFAIPIIGWLACIIMAFAAKNLNRRNYARAILVFLILGVVLAVALYFVGKWIWDAALDYLGEQSGELGDLFNQFAS
ncbi:MAG: zinc ribbon domain-containing protein [Oscillospiraceae bacterium]|jgi:hypothetical protein|nr:zinc ribbon domain-containing protein [Oscillospiraceae bacterium]